MADCAARLSSASESDGRRQHNRRSARGPYCRAGGDIVRTLNSPDVYLLLTEERAWSREEFERWLADGWVQLLLR